MNRDIRREPLDPAAFAPFGDVIDTTGTPDKIINQGLCGRFHDRAALDFTDGRAGVSLFRSEPRALPYQLEMMERHPLGSQCFIPMTADPFLVIVAADIDGRPDRPRGFLTSAGQAVNFHRNVWHGVLTPLHAPGLFAVIDRIGAGDNLEEHWFSEPFRIV